MNANKIKEMEKLYDLSPYKELPNDKVFLFEMKLCDNDVDVDYEYFAKGTIYQLEEKYLGKRGFVFDNNDAVIFHTFIKELDKETKYKESYTELRAYAYIPISDENMNAINYILQHDSFVNCSISCCVNKKICTVCGKNVFDSEHDDFDCAKKSFYYCLSDVVDVYEWAVVPEKNLRQSEDTDDCLCDCLCDEDVKDNVNSPSHYNQGGIECIDAIKSALGKNYIGFLVGNVIKYCWRYPHKNGLEDLKKASWYLDKAIKELSENE